MYTNISLYHKVYDTMAIPLIVVCILQNSNIGHMFRCEVHKDKSRTETRNTCKNRMIDRKLFRLPLPLHKRKSDEHYFIYPVVVLLQSQVSGNTFRTLSTLARAPLLGIG